MAEVKTYEIQTLKDGKWLIDHMESSRDEAVKQAELLFNEDKKLEAVVVFENAYDPVSNDAQERIIFKKSRGEPQDTIAESIQKRLKQRKTENEMPLRRPRVVDAHQNDGLENVSLTTLLVWVALGALTLGMGVRYLIEKGYLEPLW